MTHSDVVDKLKDQLRKIYQLEKHLCEVSAYLEEIGGATLFLLENIEREANDKTN